MELYSSTISILSALGGGTGLESPKVAESRWHPAILNRVGSETRPNVLYYLAGIRMHGW